VTGKGLTPLGERLRLYLRYFLVDPCPVVRACVYLSMSVYNFFSICSETSTKFYHNTVEVNFPPNLLTSQFKMATRPLLFSRHPIPSAIAKCTPLEPYTTHFDRPHQSTVFTTALIRLRRLEIGLFFFSVTCLSHPVLSRPTQSWVNFQFSLKGCLSFRFRSCPDAAVTSRLRHTR